MPVRYDVIGMFRKLKGGIMDWVAALSGLFIVSLLWIIFSGKLIYPLLLPMCDTITDVDGIATCALFRTIWAAWPIVLLVGFILLMMVSAQRRSPEYI